MVRAVVVRDRNALGRKHRCQPCGKSFYDLGKRPVVCPRCETIVAAESRPVVTVQLDLDDEESERARKLGGLTDDEVELAGDDTVADALADEDDEGDVDLTADDDADDDDRDDDNTGAEGETAG